jgi:hypothetical protein
LVESQPQSAPREMAMSRAARATPRIAAPAMSTRRQILRGYEAPADGVPSEHVPTWPEAARREFAELLYVVTAND